jgi:hypothetical protein
MFLSWLSTFNHTAIISLCVAAVLAAALAYMYRVISDEAA